MEEWLKQRGITEVECLAPDLNGVARGKILPDEKFIRSQNDNSLRLPEALDALKASKPLRETLGEAFVAVFNAVKQAEHDAYRRVVSSWEREHLLLNV